MREIKFRAWDKKNKSMICSLNHFLYFEGIIRSIGDENWSAPKEHYELMQYTGLHDKNGKEIYEGDVLGNEHIRNSEVYFMNGTFLAGDYDLFDIASGYQGDCVIIGNIYENPELLNNKP